EQRGRVERRELPSERRGVVLPALKDQPAARVGSHRLADLRRELPEVLVGDGERKAEAPRLRERVSERAGDAEEVLELVDIKEEVASLVLGPSRAGEDRLPKARHEEAPRERGGRLAPAADREIGEKDPALIHHGAHVHRGARLTEQMAESGSDEEVAQLVERRPDGLRALRLAEPFVPPPEPVEPERIAEARGDASPEGGSGEQD